MTSPGSGINPENTDGIFIGNAPGLFILYTDIKNMNQVVFIKPMIQRILGMRCCNRLPGENDLARYGGQNG
jgi:hypothetical protein